MFGAFFPLLPSPFSLLPSPFSLPPSVSPASIVSLIIPIPDPSCQLLIIFHHSATISYGIFNSREGRVKRRWDVSVIADKGIKVILPKAARDTCISSLTFFKH